MKNGDIDNAALTFGVRHTFGWLATPAALRMIVMLLLALCGPLSGFGAVTLSLPNLAADPGAKLKVPLSISDARGLMAATVTLQFDPAKLEVAETGAVTIGSMLPSGWQLMYNSLEPGQLTIILTSVDIVGLPAGGGVLFTTEFKVNSVPLGTTATIAVVNDPVQTYLSDPVPSEIPYQVVNGSVKIGEEILTELNFSGPAEDAAVRGTVEVRGTVQVADLQNWVLEVGSGYRPPNGLDYSILRLGTASETVQNGVLLPGGWNSTLYADGQYTLRIRASRRNLGTVVAYRSFRVSNRAAGPPAVNLSGARGATSYYRLGEALTISGQAASRATIEAAELADAQGTTLRDLKGQLVLDAASGVISGMVTLDASAADTVKVRIKVKDDAGNVSGWGESGGILLDNDAPEVWAVDPAGLAYVNRMPLAFVLGARDARSGVQQVRVRYNGLDWTEARLGADGFWRYECNAPMDGVFYDFDVSALDRAGNATTNLGVARAAYLLNLPGAWIHEPAENADLNTAPIIPIRVTATDVAAAATGFQWTLECAPQNTEQWTLLAGGQKEVVGVVAANWTHKYSLTEPAYVIRLTSSNRFGKVQVTRNVRVASTKLWLQTDTGDTVYLTWLALKGYTYDVLSSSNLLDWTTETPGVPGKGVLAGYEYPRANSRTFYALNTSPTVPIPQGLATAEITSSGCVVSWSGVAGAAGYRIYVSTNASFMTQVSGWQQRDVGQTAKATIDGLNPLTRYYVRVTAYNSQGDISPASGTISVQTGPPAPTIRTQSSSNHAISRGALVTLSVEADGILPLSYEWRKDGVNLAGATNSTLAIQDFQAENVGRYAVEVRNSGGATLSAVIVLSFPITIRSQSQSISNIIPGASITLNATADGFQPLSYQWIKNGVSLVGATSSTLTIQNFQAENAGQYTVEVRDSGGGKSLSAVMLLSLFASTQRMVWIESGTFTMGSPPPMDPRSGEGYDPNSMPQTQVAISKGFWMSKYETTQEEYLAVMGSNPSFNIGSIQCPVDKVSWNDATNYCARLTARENAVGRLPAGYIYRLPTEAEWEYACRGGTTTRYSFGDDESQLGIYAWYEKNSGWDSHPVGEKKPNAWGLYDMHGNVQEWCGDWYGNYPGGSVSDPRGSASGDLRVHRGGSYHYYDNAWACRSANRGANEPGDRGVCRGFRPILGPRQ